MKNCILWILLLALNTMQAQTISVNIPLHNKNKEKYLFYLHGAIVQYQGADAVSPRYGPYKYNDIVDTFKSYGFHVISEVRPKNTKASEYAEKVAGQIKELLDKGVKPEDITLVGASAGAYITIDVALKLKNKKINYAILGMCAPNTYKSYIDLTLCGNFISFYESSDSHNSCSKMFEDKTCVEGFKEIELNMGNGHGFLYQPYKEWVHPLINWIIADN